MGGNNFASTSNETENLSTKLLIEIPDNIETTMRPEICICHVPVKLRLLNEAAYTPQVISIGPIHYKKENLKGMETQKLRYLKEFLSRLGKRTQEEQKMFLEELESTIKERPNKESTTEDCKAEILKHYQDEASELFPDEKSFLRMILLDAVFIFELFLKTKEWKPSPFKFKDDFIMGKPWLRAAVQRDLTLLENQLPFCILDDLYTRATKPSNKIEGDCSPFLELSCQYFEDYKKSKTDLTKITKNMNKTEHKKPLHFTDLVRFFLSSGLPDQFRSHSPIQNLYRAKMLNHAGMQFKPLPNECLLNVKGNAIKKGELHVPPLVIDDNTECLLRNLMALEQCYYPNKAYICNYVKFLDFLVDKDEDAELLIKNKVIINRLGGTAVVADLINKLCLEIVEVSSRYDDLAAELNQYYTNTWHHSRANLSRVYFKNVWVGTGTIVGLILLFITLTQFCRSFL